MNILFLFAHLDDESFGPAGTIAKLSYEHNVTVVSMCKGDRPGNEEVMTDREKAFNRSCALLGATPIIYNSSDLKLDYFDAMWDTEEVMKQIKPDVVYTHNVSDIHRDHRLLAEVATVVCRPTPKSSVKELYMCELISATSWGFGQFGPNFVPDTYVDVTPFVDMKIEALNNYQTELYDTPDARSVNAMVELSQYRGKQVGVEFAEGFKQVYRIC